MAPATAPLFDKTASGLWGNGRRERKFFRATNHARAAATEGIRHQNVRCRQNPPNPPGIKKIKNFQPEQRARRIESADANMADAIDDFVPGELWKCTGYDCDVVVSRNEFLRESEPAFFNRAAHHRWNRQKRAEHDGDFHCVCKIASSEPAARLISNRRRKQFRAFTRSRFCSSGEVCNQRSINRVVPARSSGST